MDTEQKDVQAHDLRPESTETGGQAGPVGKGSKPRLLEGRGGWAWRGGHAWAAGKLEG